MANVLAHHVPSHARLTLALSGGLDSVVLLHTLLALRDQHPFELRVVHVHHGLSPHADDWATFCTQLCAAHDVELTIHRVQIARDDPEGIEAAARHERQRIFAALDTDFLFTAHHQDDQAETLLLQLLRGAGPKGLAAMAGKQNRPGWRATHLRPLLNVARADLLGAAREQGLAWVDDESNQDTRYRRNALRQQVMPLLAQHFPGAGRTLSRAATLQADAAGLLDDLARLDARDAIVGDRLDCAALTALTVPRARNLLRHFIEQHGQTMPSMRRLDETLRQVSDARADARVRINLGQMELWRYRGGVYLASPRLRWVEPVRWQGEAAIWVPAAGVSVRMDRAGGTGLRQTVLAAGEVTFGVRAGGEHLRLHAGGPRRSLKNLLQEYGIPPWQRERLPLMWCDGRLVWAAGIGFEADLSAAPGEAGILPYIEP
ncbi:MAG: tRNA lysidine(34) synthetase TilS [Thiobacillus sp.]